MVQTSPLRSNFRNLYLDAFWYGVLAGSLIAFLQVYVARLGASGLQVSLLSSGPAIINLILSLPAVRWLEGRSLIKVVFRTAVATRLFLVFLIPLPWLLQNPQPEIWAIIILTLLAALPTTFLAISFNSMFGEVVPARWRAEVVGRRNALLAISMTVTTFLCGWLLDQVDFPGNYQIVFGIGVIGAALTTYYLKLIRPMAADSQPALAQPAPDKKPLIRIDLLRTKFGPLIFAYLFFYFAQYVPIPSMPLFWVNDLKIGDEIIGISNGIYYAVMILGSVTLPRLSAKIGNHKALALSALVYASYPIIVSLAHDVPLLMVGAVVGGLGWGLANGSLLNYLIDRAPADDRPAHMAWYNIALNLGILLGSSSGAILETAIGPRYALLVGGILRALAGLVFLMWG